MIVIPYKDDNPRILTPHVTRFIIGLNVLVFLFQLTLSADAQQGLAYHFGTVPAWIFNYESNLMESYTRLPFIPSILSLFTSIFLHAGIYHLLGNMVFTYIFADNIESILGHRLFFVYFLVCGAAGSLAQSISSPESVVPIIGASGAISGVMAGYMLKYPSAKIHVLALGFIPVTLPALLVIGIYFMNDLFSGFISLGKLGGGVAYFAHIGGFIAGAVQMVVFSKGRFYWLNQ